MKNLELFYEATEKLMTEHKNDYPINEKWNLSRVHINEYKNKVTLDFTTKCELPVTIVMTNGIVSKLMKKNINFNTYYTDEIKKQLEERDNEMDHIQEDKRRRTNQIDEFIKKFLKGN